MRRNTAVPSMSLNFPDILQHVKIQLHMHVKSADNGGGLLAPAMTRRDAARAEKRPIYKKAGELNQELIAHS